MLADTKIKKAYLRFDCGFVDTIFIDNPPSCRSNIFLYSKVQSSLTVSDKKYCEYWYKQNLRDTYKLVLVVWQVQARVTMH